MTAHGRRREIGRRILLLAFGCGVAVGLSEVGLRFVYREPWYMRLAAEQVRNETLPYRRNALGLRDTDYAADKPAGTQRVLFLGDSFTFGQGVPDDSAVMPELIERRLNREGRRVEVLNGGIPGSLTGDWVRLMERVAPVFHPDAIVTVFFLRDGTRTSFFTNFFRPIRNQVVARNQASRLYRYSFVYRVLRDGLDRRRVATLYGAALLTSYTGRDEQVAEWRLAQHNLLAIAAYARAHQESFALAIYPALVGLDQSPYPFQVICDTVRAFATRNGMPVHDLLDDFRGQDAAALWVSALDQHPNARGHAIAAEGLLPLVRTALDAQPAAAGMPVEIESDRR